MYEGLDNSDTYYLSKFIEEKKAMSLSDIQVVLSGLNRCWVELWVICAVDTLSKEILLYSDGHRSLVVNTNADESIMHSFSSLTDSWSDEFSFSGFAILDFDWNISTIDYLYKNKKKIPKTSSVVVTHKQYKKSSIPYSSYEEEEYYNWYTSTNKTSTAEIEEYIDPATIVSSHILTTLSDEFYCLESEMSTMRSKWATNTVIYYSNITDITNLANRISKEMFIIVDKYYEDCANSWRHEFDEFDELYEYIESERLGIMEIVLEYNNNFEYEESI